jgi:P27 family predicted phage terminase small subunit|nr:MAG TPA: terminase small subunit [Caudoviricetes sp.]
MNDKFKIPTDIEDEAKEYIKDVLTMLESNGVMEDVDTAALTMLARNYSVFIKASKQLEKDGLTVTSDRGNIAAHPAIKIANDAQTKAMKVMVEFGLTAKARTKLPKLEANTGNDSPLEAFIKNNKKKEVR